MPTASAVPSINADVPSTADAEAPIVVFINITSDLAIDEVMLTYINPYYGFLIYENMNLTSGNATNGTWFFEIPSQNYKGTLDVWITATDISGASARYPASGEYVIELDGPEPEEPFPWNIVLIVAFLAIVLVATELIFKPGFYRPTGRQRAEALEEEDRKKAEEK